MPIPALSTTAGTVTFSEEDGALYATLNDDAGNPTAVASTSHDDGVWQVSTFITADDTAAPLDDEPHEQARTAILEHLKSTAQA